ncbi:hypothetical protein L195_g007448 [Trifolium pratense]|uniref:Uncharacterized protein n=1 Tax=Trifolium pratense TaxID=57577 RepID=A0A2K3P6D2_TRIPR|nr:hypothetical protein L195_g015253 [Trifolium pratense]PNX98757.1 hypothetical protein L195_g022014 [Trifolium pratense]PNY10857.1 hypothetical protein L195_g007448 [Trifolium pratense]
MDEKVMLVALQLRWGGYRCGQSGCRCSVIGSKWMEGGDDVVVLEEFFIFLHSDVFFTFQEYHVARWGAQDYPTHENDPKSP